ncbi:hypothetical protein Afil01_47390 [Actinorhabdospora filicis]|uniref:Clp R domain-containing protein n=1 Tax=Actinorhabdospora filicis TaxID=1785913 RepID=A0A9W6SPV0_9ACTN|nr:caspase family protein [Actinorhabdospora filicis]GLZ79932.1 hypothetical protein Afil01_47390 [Actinorhabdospora filicis]
MEDSAEAKLVKLSAQHKARTDDHIGTEHLLLALLDPGGSEPWRSVARALAERDITHLKVEHVLRTELQRFEYGSRRGQYTANLAKVLSLAESEAVALGSPQVDSSHLLLALVRHWQGRAMYALDHLGHDQDGMRRVALAALPRPIVPPDVLSPLRNESSVTESYEEADVTAWPTTTEPASPTGTTPMDWMGEEQARAVSVPPTWIGRFLTPVTGADAMAAEDEVERLYRVLIRAHASNAVLLARPGMDAMSVLKGLARRVEERRVANPLQDTVIRHLDWAAIARETYGGDAFYRELRRILTDLSGKRALLAISDAPVYLDFANPRRPGSVTAHLWALMESGALQVALILTPDEYETAKAALTRNLFGTVQVVEPTIERTTDIVRARVPDFARRYKVHIPPETLEAAVVLADRHVTDRFQPAKSIELLSIACAEVAPMVATGRIETVTPEVVRAALAHELSRDIAGLRLPGEAAPAAPPAPSRDRLPVRTESYALLVGTAHYDDPALEPLESVAANLTGLGEVLAHPEHGGFDPSRVTTLLNPSRHEFRAKLKELSAIATDTFLLYFAGHGLADPYTPALYLGVRDAESLDPADTALPYATVGRHLESGPARNKILVLDCCFSGRALDGTMGPGDGPIRTPDIGGTYILTASAATQPALAPPGETHTAFTGALLELFTEGVDSPAEFIHPVREFARLTELVRARASQQDPQQRNTNTIGELGLVRNRRYRAVSR